MRRKPEPMMVGIRAMTIGVILSFWIGLTSSELPAKRMAWTSLFVGVPPTEQSHRSGHSASRGAQNEGLARSENPCIS
jgi:hypothetical protein